MAWFIFYQSEITEQADWTVDIGPGSSSPLIEFPMACVFLCSVITLGKCGKMPECIFIVLDFRVCPVAQMTTCGNNFPSTDFNGIIWEKLIQVSVKWMKCEKNMFEVIRIQCFFTVIVFSCHHENTNDYTNCVNKNYKFKNDLNHLIVLPSVLAKV